MDQHPTCFVAETPTNSYTPAGLNPGATYDWSVVGHCITDTVPTGVLGQWSNWREFVTP